VSAGLRKASLCASSTKPAALNSRTAEAASKARLI
jgi:hypothetical protein